VFVFFDSNWSISIIFLLQYKVYSLSVKMWLASFGILESPFLYFSCKKYDPTWKVLIKNLYMFPSRVHCLRATIIIYYKKYTWFIFQAEKINLKENISYLAGMIMLLWKVNSLNLCRNSLGFWQNYFSKFCY